MEKEELLQKLYKECIQELNRIGINFEGKQINIILSKRNNMRYGCCKPELPNCDYKNVIRKGFKYIIKYDDYKKYTIEISRWVLDLNNDIIKNTIMHELIHCLPYCNNHGTSFKKYANLINTKLGYNISRVGNKKLDFEKSNIKYNKEKEEKYKYKIKCEKCDIIFYRKRLQKNFIKKYRCSKCLGKLKILEVK